MSAPDRIHGWLNTQLSIARHYGGCSFNGADYVIAYGETDQPLVRVDVLKREEKEAKARRKAGKVEAVKAQGELL